MPDLAIIARVGAHSMFIAHGATEEKVIAPETPFGRSAPLHFLRYQGLFFVVLSRHGEEKYSLAAPFVNDRANVWALKTCGIRRILSWSAPGSLNPTIAPGDLVLVDDLIDETRSGPGTFFEGKGIGVIRQNPTFCPELRGVMGQVLESTSFTIHHKGIYVSVEGPRLETAAEIRKFRLFGGDLIGMNLAPETFLARELEICYGAVCYAVNFAEGMLDRPYQPGVLFEGLSSPEEIAQVKKVEAAFPELLLAILSKVQESPLNCFCQESMRRYKERGDIGPDFRTWIK
ncbi:MAG: phosphorylase [Desulfobacca sp.]|nr:phosphorylase [Desulfobacca sp.]